MVPIYTKKQKIDVERDEYIKILDSNAENLRMECKFEGENMEIIDVDIRFDKDPTFSKRMRVIALSVPFGLMESFFAFAKAAVR